MRKREIFSVMRKSELAVGPELNRAQRIAAGGAASASGTSVAHRTISTASKGKENSAEGAQRAPALIQFTYTVVRVEFKSMFDIDKNATTIS